MELLEIFIPLGLAILGGLIWLVRLEGRVNLASKEANEVSSDFYKHLSDRDVHPSSTDLDRRFNEFHSDLSEIKTHVQQGFVEVNRRLDTVLSK